MPAVAALLATGVVALLSVSGALAAETSIPGVTAEVAHFRQHGGVLRVGVRFRNATDKPAGRSEAFRFADVVLVDAAARRKHFALRDADKRFLAGPIADWNDGGRWFPRIEPRGEVLVWAMFEGVAPGSRIALEMPVAGRFEGLVPKEAASAARRVTSSQPPVVASLISAARSPGELVVKLLLENPERRPTRSGQALVYRDAYALDPVGKRRYPLLKGDSGLYLAEPRSDRNDGGRYFLSQVPPGGSVTMSLTFQPPPDSVRGVDIVVPHFPPFEDVAIAGVAGAAPSGIAVAGRSESLAQALRDLGAVETPAEIMVNLAADVMFDFDKATLKPEAEAALRRVATVIAAHPNARVSVAGHTDGKGGSGYNQALSERRAEAVGAWLVANAGVAREHIQTRGYGMTRPVAPNTKADGSDDPEGRQRNRRVEILVKK